MLTANYDTLGLKSGDRILDLGCGFGRHAYEAARRGAHVVALDAGRDEVEGVLGTFAAMVDAGELTAETSHVGVVQGDALHLPFPDGTFDRVICSEVLEHIPDDVGAMRELARVLKSGGTMAITVPRFGPELVNWALSDEYHMVEGGHVRIYRRSVIEDRFRSVGMVVTRHHYAHGLHSPYWWLKCLVGTTNNDNRYVKAYHDVLAKEIMGQSKAASIADRALSPVMGKSIVFYLRKPTPA